MTKLTRLCLLFSAYLFTPGLAVAQQYFDPGLLQKTIDRKPAEFVAKGVRMGSFILNPGIELAYESNDNIFYLPNNFEISDNIMHTRPWLNLNSDWNRHQLSINAMADFGRYSDFGSENYDDWVVNLDGRFDVKRGSFLDYSAAYLNLHEDRSDPNGRGGIHPTEFDMTNYGVGYTHTFNRLAATLDFRSSEFDYKNNINLEGEVLDNQDRDRTQDHLGLRLAYELSDQNGVFFAIIGNDLDYDQKVDNQGYLRSSDGYELQLGASWDMTGLLVGDVYLAYFDQDYDDPRFNNVDGVRLGASLDWTPTELTNVNVRFANGTQATTQEGSSGYLSSLYSVRIQHELLHNFLANARFSYTDNDYQNNDIPGSLSKTKVTRAGVGLSYLLNRNVYFSGGYIYEKQNANLDRFNYRTNRWFITVGAEF